MRGLLTGIFTAAGCRLEEAQAVAEHAVWAEHSNLPQQGLWRVGKYLDKLMAGGYDLHSQLSQQQTAASIVVVDGQNHMGPYVATVATKRAKALAQGSGIGLVCVGGSNHFGAGGYYGEQLAEAGLVGIVATNSAPRIAAPKSGRRLLGNNVLVIAAPGNDGTLIIDLAAGQSSAGILTMAAEQSLPIHEGILAQQSADLSPASMAAAAIKPMAGHKGFALGLGLEILCATLGGSAVLTEVKSYIREPDKKADIGHFILAIDPDKTIGKRAYLDIMDRLVSILDKNGEHLPGVLRRRQRQVREKQDCKLSAANIDILGKWAERFGVKLPW